MNKMTMMGVWLIALFSTGCNQDLVEYNSNDLKISIEKGYFVELHIQRRLMLYTIILKT